MRKIIHFILLFLLSASGNLYSQSYNWVSSSEDKLWTQSKISLEREAAGTPDVIMEESTPVLTFKAWGTCFNELGWDALNTLPGEEKENILKKIFASDGDLKFTLGRISMNANDYARDWYSCDEVPGDFDLKYFNIERDKKTLIPYIKSAQRYNPDITFWISPWSPPSWMKINQDYPVRSDKKHNKLPEEKDNYLNGNMGPRSGNLFPRALALNDFMIQDARYLKTYANYFSKFISAYQEQGIPIDMVMFQNESWSYTPYPGCAWTPEGIIRFNAEYLAPVLKAAHPNVSLYLGTINTNRYDIIDQILSDSCMSQAIQGVGVQWEGGQLLSRLRDKYPQYKYVQTESECGRGTFDWRAGEHTFHLINHYLGNGCEEYTFWNVILCDYGISPWGWKQNALIRVDSKARTATYTPEYYAVKHYAQYVVPGSVLVASKATGDDKKPVLVFRTPEKKYIVIAGNFKGESQPLTIKLGERYLNVSLAAHSFNSFQMK